MRKSFARSTAIGAAVFSFLLSSSLTVPAFSESLSSKSVANAVPLTGIIHSDQVIGKKDFVVSKTLVHASPERVFDIVTDYSNATRYFTNLTNCHVLSEKNGVKHVRFNAKASGLMKLDYVLAIDQSKQGRIEWTRVKGSFKANEGYWDLAPVDNGKSTLVTYAKHVDPGFFAPKMFVHKTLRDTADNIFRDLKRSVEAPQVAVDSNLKIK
jgi:ribosome-associated toxin RatA of RatAB toxin-antitoxin module